MKMDYTHKYGECLWCGTQCFAGNKSDTETYYYCDNCKDYAIETVPINKKKFTVLLTQEERELLRQFFTSLAEDHPCRKVSMSIENYQEYLAMARNLLKGE